MSVRSWSCREWSREYRKLAREVERLKLAWKASLVEQDLSNDLERRMCEEAASSKRKVDDGWAVGREVESYVEHIIIDLCRPQRTTTTQRQCTDWSRVLKKREPVGLEGPYPCSILPASLSPLSPIRQLDTGPYDGFSSYPLFFGQTEFTLIRGQRKNNVA